MEAKASPKLAFCIKGTEEFIPATTFRRCGCESTESTY